MFLTKQSATHLPTHSQLNALQNYLEIAMTLKEDMPEKLTRYTSVEEVIALWRSRLGDEWVDKVLALPNIEQEVTEFAQHTGRTLPDAWASYISSIMLSRI